MWVLILRFDGLRQQSNEENIEGNIEGALYLKTKDKNSNYPNKISFTHFNFCIKFIDRSV